MKPVTQLSIADLRKLAKSTHGHSRDCKKRIDECYTCQSTIEWFRQLPLETLSKVLTE